MADLQGEPKNGNGYRKNFYGTLSIAVLVVSLSVAYYFVLFLPKKEQQYLNLQQEKQEAENLKEARKTEIADQAATEESARRKREVAKDVQEDCLKKGLSVSYDFSIENTYASPLFYPYEDVSSVNKDERLVTALGSYRNCLMSDPRNDGDNEVLDSISRDALTALLAINEFISDTLKKHPNYCQFGLLSDAAKQKYCEP